MRHLNSADLLAIDRELARRSLADFAKMAWPLLEPSTPLVWDWPLDAICAHLEAVTRGEINRLLINVSPGTMKSLLTSVLWPAWEWGPRGLPHMRIIGTAHKESLAVRDAMKMRRVVKSEWYKRRWKVALVDDQDAKTKFENTATGFRESSAFTSMTGVRGDRVILDDPHSVNNALSPVDLKSVETTFREALPTRINNDRSAIVVIMQRLHERDVSGVILSEGLPYVHLCIPMRCEKDAAKSTPYFTDPRTKDGELMMPGRFSEAAVAELEKTLGTYGAAGQLQQRPAPRGGGMFIRSNFKTWVGEIPADTRWIRAWDLAATDDPNAAWTVGLRMGVTPDENYIISDVRRVQATAQGVERLLVGTAKADGRKVPGSLPQDPGQAGKAQVAYLLRKLSGFVYRSSPETGDKETRAQPFASQVEAGNVYIVPGEWNKAYLDELETFPAGRWMDQVDASSRAFNELTMRKRSILDVL